MKKIFTTIGISICMLMCISINSLQAAENHEENIYETNEYYTLVNQKALEKTTNNIKSTKQPNEVGKYEKLYLERAQLDEETLKNKYFYTDEQIKILKEYDGGPIEDHPELSLASATLTAPINEAAITFIYGHCDLLMGVSVSYPTGIGLSINNGTKEVYLSKRVTSTGVIK